MAGGKLSARQKMINLMYLVFIAMMAMNMSKEVLRAFGLMNERLTESIKATTERNDVFMAGLAEKVNEQRDKYQPLKVKADQITSLTKQFFDYIEDVKQNVLLGKVDKEKLNDYQTLDKTDVLDGFFNGDKYTPKGQEFVDKLNEYKNGVKTVLGDEYPEITNDLEAKFSTNDVINNDGKEIKWLDYHFKGYPLIASLTKMTQLQADAETITNETLSAMYAGKLTTEISMTNYTTLLETSKSAYFNSDTFDGSIVLGRKDNTTRPNKVELTLDGRALVEGKDFTIEDGRVKFNFNAGRPGEHKIEGKLIFNESGVEIEVDVNQSYAAVPKPNSATISAWCQ
jgi:gliding motility-associated protein GldM